MRLISPSLTLASVMLGVADSRRPGHRRHASSYPGCGHSTWPNRTVCRAGWGWSRSAATFPCPHGVFSDRVDRPPRRSLGTDVEGQLLFASDNVERTNGPQPGRNPAGCEPSSCVPVRAAWCWRRTGIDQRHQMSAASEAFHVNVAIVTVDDRWNWRRLMASSSWPKMLGVKCMPRSFSESRKPENRRSNTV